MDGAEFAGIESCRWIDNEGPIHWVASVRTGELAVWKAKKRRGSLRDGENRDDPMPQAVLRVETAKLERLNSSEQGKCVTVVYRKETLRAALSGPYEFFNIWCSSTSKRDELLARARFALEPTFEFRRVKYGPWRAALPPLILAVPDIAWSWAFGKYAAEASAGRLLSYNGRYDWAMDLIYPLLARLGQTGVWAIGMVVGLALLVWLIRRIQERPVLLTLVRRTLRRGKGAV